MIIAAIRNGKETFRSPMTVRADGTCWSPSGSPLFDGQSPASKALGTAKIKALVQAHDWDAIPLGCYAQFGQNESGLLVVDAAAYYAQKRAQTQAALTPAQRERREIDKLFRDANSRIDDTDEMNVQDHYSGLAKARARLTQWREAYPSEARAEAAAGLREQAERKRALAAGALTYDADGSISQTEQQKRHDYLTAEADTLEAKATAKEQN